MRKSMQKAFTLAEVLIALGIIGIIAALTIPGLVANYQKKVLITRLQKFYNIQVNSANIMESDGECSFANSAALTDSPDFAIEYIDCRYKPYVKNLAVKKLTKGAAIALADGSGVYVNKGSLHEISWYHNLEHVFCVDYKDCENIDENVESVFQWPDGKTKFSLNISSFSFQEQQDRDVLKTHCTDTNKWGCGALILHDGWEIKDDYPW